jgi:hypothetical protein
MCTVKPPKLIDGVNGALSIMFGSSIFPPISDMKSTTQWRSLSELTTQSHYPRLHYSALIFLSSKAHPSEAVMASINHRDQTYSREYWFLWNPSQTVRVRNNHELIHWQGFTLLQ